MYDNFKLFTELDIDKSTKDLPKDNEDRYKNMVFSGVASDRTKDAEAESLDPNGFVYDRFLKYGLFNLDHLPTRSPVNKSRWFLGEPISAEVKDGKFFVKGKLWEKSPEARAFWDKAIEMSESGSSRKPGMSVEGKALERDPKNPSKVTKALITNVALTFTPVNPSTYLDIQKSKGDCSFESPKDFITSNILLEYETGGKMIQIGKDFKVSIKDTKGFDTETFWDIYKAHQRGDISKKVLDDFVRKTENKLVSTK